MSEDINTVTYNGTDYPVDELSDMSIRLVNMLVEIRAKKNDLHKELDILNSAEAQFNTLLNEELNNDQGTIDQ